MAEIDPSWPTRPRAMRASCNGSVDAGARELDEVGAQQRADVDVAEGRRHLPVDDAHHLLGGDAVGRHRGDEGAGAGADVDVELVDGAVDRQQVERPQRADLVDAAGEAAAAEHERRLGAASRGACPSRAAVRRCLPASRSTTLPMRDGQYRRRDSPLHLVFYGPAACVIGYVLSSSRWSPRSPSSRRAPRRRSRPRRCRPSSTREMRHAGGFSGAFVRDLDSRRDAVRRPSADAPRAPASVEKLYTTASALHALRARRDAADHGRRARVPRPRRRLARRPLPARRRRSRRSAATTCSASSRAVGAAGILRVDGSVLGDESRFDLLRGSFDTGGAYDRDIGGVLGALALNRGFSKDGRPAAAGRAAVRRRPCAADGIRVEGAQRRRHRAGRRRRSWPRVASPPMRDLIRLTNVPSDNFLAEMLLKDLGAEFGGAGTTAAGVGVVEHPARRASA